MGMGGGGMGVINELLVQMDGFTVAERSVAARPADRVPGRAEGALLQHPRHRGDEPGPTLDPALSDRGGSTARSTSGCPTPRGAQDILQYYLAKVRHEPIDYTSSPG